MKQQSRCQRPFAKLGLASLDLPGSGLVNPDLVNPGDKPPNCDRFPSPFPVLLLLRCNGINRLIPSCCGLYSSTTFPVFQLLWVYGPRDESRICVEGVGGAFTSRAA